MKKIEALGQIIQKCIIVWFLMPLATIRTKNYKISYS